MKKIIYLLIVIVSASFCVTSCKNEDEKAKDAEQQLAIEYLKSTLASPSSFKLIGVTVSGHEDSISYDTLYHVKKLTYSYALTDSMKIMEVLRPKHKEYQIIYDASNEFGAIIRDEDEIVICNGKPYEHQEFTSMFLENKKEIHKEAQVNKFMNPSSHVFEDDWSSILFLEADRLILP